MNAKIMKWGAGALLLLGMAACKSGEAAEETGKFTTALVKRDNLVISAEATGTVEPIRQVDVKSKASGEILQLNVDVGDSVSAGQLLAKVDPRDVKNAFDQAQADLTVAKKRQEISGAQLGRSKDLYAAGVITESDYESAELDFANAQSTLVKAQTNFELAQLRLSDATITAPMRGTILAKTVEEGQVIQSASSNVSGGTTLFTMANLDEMQVRTLVDETDVGQLRKGLEASVKVEAYPDRTFHGQVQKIEPQAVNQQNVTMFNVIVNLDNHEGLLKPGMNAEVTIIVNQAPNVLMVPNGAIVQPREVGPAALALGLDIDKLDLTQFGAFGGRRNGGDSASGARGTSGRSGNFRGAGGQAGAQAGDPADPQDPAGGASRGTAGGQRMAGGQRSGGQRMGAQGQARFSGARSAEFDSLRAKVARGEITQDSMRVLVAAMRQGAMGQDSTAATTKAVVVFVVKNGVPQPRLIRVGINDWDNTEVVSGLEENDTLAVVSAAQLQAQQQEFLNRIRSRAGGMFPGGGMMGGGPRGR
jgi:HlyD family secretion protein